MNKAYKILAAMVLFAMVVASCGNSNPGLGESFTLKVGQTAAINGEDLKLKFDAVVSDSRCPSDVQCIRAGEAEVRVIATQNGIDTSLTMVEEGLTSGLNVVDYKNYTIEFKLTPYPVSTHQIQTSEYRLELTVTKS